MPNIASVLRVEIARVARKEGRLETDTLKKLVALHRAEIAALKKRINALEVALRQLAKPVRQQVMVDASAPSEKGLRFSAKGLLSQRRRLGLSAGEVGLLLGASSQSIYNWEAGSARPRASHMAAIAGFKLLSKKSAARRLAQLAEAGTGEAA